LDPLGSLWWNQALSMGYREKIRKIRRRPYSRWRLWVLRPVGGKDRSFCLLNTRNTLFIYRITYPTFLYLSTGCIRARPPLALIRRSQCGPRSDQFRNSFYAGFDAPCPKARPYARTACRRMRLTDAGSSKRRVTGRVTTPRACRALSRTKSFSVVAKSAPRRPASSMSTWTSRGVYG
jgi:hypothetical protein